MSDSDRVDALKMAMRALDGKRIRYRPPTYGSGPQGFKEGTGLFLESTGRDVTHRQERPGDASLTPSTPPATALPALPEHAGEGLTEPRD